MIVSRDAKCAPGGKLNVKPDTIFRYLVFFCFSVGCFLRFSECFPVISCVIVNIHIGFTILSQRFLNVGWCTQGRNEVRWRPGQEASLASPMFEPEDFRKQIHSIEESSCDIVGTSRRLHSDSASGKLWPLVTPLSGPPSAKFPLAVTTFLRVHGIST